MFQMYFRWDKKKMQPCFAKGGGWRTRHKLFTGCNDEFIMLLSIFQIVRNTFFSLNQKVRVAETDVMQFGLNWLQAINNFLIKYASLLISFDRTKRTTKENRACKKIHNVNDNPNRDRHVNNNKKKKITVLNTKLWYFYNKFLKCFLFYAAVNVPLSFQRKFFFVLKYY